MTDAERMKKFHFFVQKRARVAINFLLIGVSGTNPVSKIVRHAKLTLKVFKIIIRNENKNICFRKFLSVNVMFTFFDYLYKKVTFTNSLRDPLFNDHVLF